MPGEYKESKSQESRDLKGKLEASHRGFGILLKCLPQGIWEIVKVPDTVNWEVTKMPTTGDLGNH